MYSVFVEERIEALGFYDARSKNDKDPFALILEEGVKIGCIDVVGIEHLDGISLFGCFFINSPQSLLAPQGLHIGRIYVYMYRHLSITFL